MNDDLAAGCALHCRLLVIVRLDFLDLDDNALAGQRHLVIRRSRTRGGYTLVRNPIALAVSFKQLLGKCQVAAQTSNLPTPPARASTDAHHRPQTFADLLSK